MREILAALDAQQTELDSLLRDLDDDGWATPVPACPGWSVADVVLHLAQTDEMGAASAGGRLLEFATGNSAGGELRGNVDDWADRAVEAERGLSGADIRARWRAATSSQRDGLSDCLPSQRVQWVAGAMAARTLATTRLSETWIHTTDVAGALGVELPPTERLWHIARLAWRTLPYAFGRADRSLSGPVSVTLGAPGGDTWEFAGDTPAVTEVSGPALDFCLVAGRRRDPRDTELKASGADAEAVLELVRTYA